MKPKRIYLMSRTILLFIFGLIFLKNAKVYKTFIAAMHLDLLLYIIFNKLQIKNNGTVKLNEICKIIITKKIFLCEEICI